MKAFVITLLILVSINFSLNSQEPYDQFRGLFNETEENKAIGNILLKCSNDFFVTCNTNVVNLDKIEKEYDVRKYFRELILGKRYDFVKIFAIKGNTPNFEVHGIKCHINNINVRSIYFIIERLENEDIIIHSVIDSIFADGI